jgi:hypothetical protein
MSYCATATDLQQHQSIDDENRKTHKKLCLDSNRCIRDGSSAGTAARAPARRPRTRRDTRRTNSLRYRAPLPPPLSSSVWVSSLRSLSRRSPMRRWPPSLSFVGDQKIKKHGQQRLLTDDRTHRCAAATTTARWRRRGRRRAQRDSSRCCSRSLASDPSVVCV